MTTDEFTVSEWKEEDKHIKQQELQSTARICEKEEVALSLRMLWYNLSYNIFLHVGAV